jgi:hypothetical protein
VKMSFRTVAISSSLIIAFDHMIPTNLSLGKIACR